MRRSLAVGTLGLICAGVLGLIFAGVLIPSRAAGDSFTPVRLTIKVAPVARRGVRLKITVKVSADPGVLDTRTAPLRIRVKLASECGGTYQYTPGVVLLDKQLKPQPTTGKAYTAVARGRGKPNSYGIKTACVFLEEEGDQRVFASDQSTQVNVSKRCTIAAARFDAARRRSRGSQLTRGDRRAARRACGPGVRL